MAVVLIISLCGMVASAELFNQIDNDTTSLMLEDFESVSNYRTHVKRENRNDYESPRPDQRSLLIVFDATGSMHDDLEQLRAGAQEIINEFSVRADNPIYNYVLVVYRDPTVEAPFETTNPEELMMRLEQIQVAGGGDCPEYALNGLIKALEPALLNSLAYVFSDATAKDYRHYDVVLEMIQKKQVSVNFLLTGNCDVPSSDPGYKVYHKLSHASNGQVYDMNKSNVKDVLVAIRHTVNSNYVALKSVDTELSGATNTRLSIDKSISELSVSLSGKNPKLTIKDPRNETVASGDELSLQNLKLVKIKDPIEGSWNVESEADSSHSIRVGAISDIKFEFGFSVDEPLKHSETSFQPLGDHKNVLSIFVADPTLIANLSDVEIILVPTQAHESSIQFIIPLKQIANHIFVTKPFEVPRQMFKIQLNGVDVHGNLIERLISTGLKASLGSVPDIKIDANRKEIKENEKLFLKCIVKSHTPVNISWVFKGKTLTSIASTQSNDIEYVVDRATKANAGEYSCDAINGFGGERKAITIKVASPPKVLVFPSRLATVENSSEGLECIVEDQDDKMHEITWIDVYGNVLRNNVSSDFKFIANRDYNNKTVTCQIQHGDSYIRNSSLITVEYMPKFLTNEEENREVHVTHGKMFELNCESDELPKGQVQWFFSSLKKKERTKLPEHESLLIIQAMTEDRQGIYECNVENVHGRIKRSFNVVDIPKASPKILLDKDVIIVNETGSIDLVCETLNSLPITNFSWFNENSNNYEKFIQQDDLTDRFKSFLRIIDIDESDNGSFECFLANLAGEDKITIELLVQTAPKIDSISMRIEESEVEVEIDEQVSVMMNQVVSFECIADAFPTARIQWFIGQNEIEVGENNTLIVNPRKVGEVSNYQCVAENILGMATRNFDIIVNAAPLATNLSENFVKIVEDSEISLSCDVVAFPAPNYSWFVNQRLTNETGKMFKLKVQLKDSGMYSCLAANVHGETSINFTVVVLGVPRVLIPEDEQFKAKVGSAISLACNAVGFPQPIVSWSKNDQNIFSGSTLMLDNLELEDAGVYICEASNEVGTSQKVFYVNIVDPPKVLSTFENLTLHTNQTASVKCASKGFPVPEIFWTFGDLLNEIKIKDGSEITFNSSMLSGMYNCVARSSEEASRSSIFFQAMNKPSLIPRHDELKKEIKLREGDDLELLCPFENFNEIKWMINEKAIDQNHFDVNFNKLLFFKTDRSHSGIWRCRVSNHAGVESFSFNVTVVSSPIVRASWNLNSGDFLVTESNIDEKTFQVGENLQLKCNAEGFPQPQVVWKKSTDVIADGEVLTIENLQFHHSDIYTCSALNELGNVKKFFKVDVVSGPFVDNLEPQKIHFQKAIGDSLLLKCNVLANPLPNIFWFKNNELIEDETETHLEIKSLVADDDGNYKCIAKNAWGKINLHFNVTIMNAAKIVNAGEALKNNSNADSLRVTCTAQGTPLPVLSWVLNGHILSTTSKIDTQKLFSAAHDSTVYFNGHGNSIRYLDHLAIKRSLDKFYSQLTKLNDKTVKLDIVFKERRRQSAGSYNCYAYNALGRDERAVEVNVHEKPFVNEQQLKQLHDNEVLEGLPLLLSCLISGEPTPQITWYKNNLQLHENDTFKLLNENRFLSVAETFPWHSGNYSCKGVNDVGQEQISFQVVVLSPPKFINYYEPTQVNDQPIVVQKIKTKEVKTVTKGDDLILECFSKGFPEPQVHWLRLNSFDSNKNELLEVDENIFVIKSIQEYSMFMCYLNNTIGSASKIFEVITQSAPQFIERSHFERHEVVKLHHGINLNCKADGSPEPDVKWFFNGSNVSDNEKEFYFFDHNHILRIIDAKKSNQGKFLCIAENGLGRIEKSFLVQVEVPIQWSAFGSWSSCSVSCGPDGIQYRTRNCLLSSGKAAKGDDNQCIGESIEMRKCLRLPCPVNGKWGKFSEWSKCPECIKENELPVNSKRTRKCDSPPSAHGGLDCDGDETEIRECKIDYCPINGNWSKWSNWSSCGKTCGVTFRMRKRFCNNPSPKYNGSYCEGENVEYDDCKLRPCLNENLKKSFSVEDEDELEELSNENRDKYSEAVEFEFKRRDDGQRDFQFLDHPEVEFSPPIRKVEIERVQKTPKIIVSLDTYGPLSKDSYNQHLNKLKHNEVVESNNLDNLSFENTDSTEISQTNTRHQRHSCIRGFRFNQLNEQCEDINECLDRRLNRCADSEKCVNAMGSFRCQKTTRNLRE